MTTLEYLLLAGNLLQAYWLYRLATQRNKARSAAGVYQAWAGLDPHRPRGVVRRAQPRPFRDSCGLFLVLALGLLWSAAAWAQSAIASESGGTSVITGGDRDGWATHIVFKVADGINQVEVAHTTVWVDARQIVPATLAFTQDPCETYQYDTVWGLAPAGRYTLSDLGNLPLLASGLIRPTKHCRNEPDPIPPPPCTTKIAQYRGFYGWEWLATSAPWYETVRGPYVLPAIMAEGGAWQQIAITADEYHKTDKDYSRYQENEQLYYMYWPSRLVSSVTQDVLSDALVTTTDLGTITLPPGQTHFYVLHAGTIKVNESGVPVPSDSVKPVWMTWKKVCQ